MTFPCYSLKIVISYSVPSSFFSHLSQFLMVFNEISILSPWILLHLWLHLCICLDPITSSSVSDLTISSCLLVSIHNQAHHLCFLYGFLFLTHFPPASEHLPILHYHLAPFSFFSLGSASSSSCFFLASIHAVSTILSLCILSFYQKGGDVRFLQNISKFLPDYTISHARRLQPSAQYIVC
jgi:hypothetical protein